MAKFTMTSASPTIRWLTMKCGKSGGQPGRNTGCSLYTGKWNASTDSTASPARVRAMTPVILPFPSSMAPDWWKTAVGFLMMGGGFIRSHVRCNGRSLHRAIGLCYPPFVSSPLPWPALIATARGALWRAGDGTIERLSAADAAMRAAGGLPLVCHAPAGAAPLRLEDLPARDPLGRLAFVPPARLCLPPPPGPSPPPDLRQPAPPEDK